MAITMGYSCQRVCTFSRLVFGIGLLAIVGCTSQPSKTRAQAAVQNAPTPASAARPSPETLLRRAAAQPSAPFDGEGWRPLDDGKSLAGWRVTDFAGHGEVQRRFGVIVLEPGDPMTGINGTKAMPRMNYEIGLDAMRVSGSDFLCGLTVPVGESYCSLIVGGWGGSLVGISSLDGQDASENETTSFMDFTAGRWYRIRLRVTEGKLEAWIDQQKVVDVVTTGRRISLRPGEIELSRPFGIAAYACTSGLRQIKVRIFSPSAAH
jgi:hypothetical protein